MTEEQQRARIVETALSWQRTPYHHMGRVKGAGADCLTFLAEVYEEAGLTPHIDVPFYPQDWMYHKSAELYMTGLMEYAHEIEGPPKPGDIALWKVCRCYSHGAIVIQWPLIIHAQVKVGIVQDDAEKSSFLTHIGENTSDKGKPRPLKFFSLFEG